uniref:Uncharacterized protein n=1 Tax=uncultured marine crenarchaeote KM3-47-D6 TaxID=526680 RepID=B3V587_9ARCH|nr:hypothetical protein [uncultured marine crenarchaeote KM3-47-D6]
MAEPSFTDFYKSLMDFVKTFEEKNTILKVEEDLALDIIRIFGEGVDSVSRAKNGLEDVVELSYTTAEHHPYWALLYNCSQISKSVLEKWNDELTEEDLSEIRWMISELENSCNKLKSKMKNQDSRDK